MANSSKVNDCVKPPFNGCHETTTAGRAIEYRERGVEDTYLAR